MMRLPRAAMVALVSVGMSAACVYAPVRPGRPSPPLPRAEHAHKQGPPPHAPAHGYRHKQRDGIDLVFDSGLGVYVVAGRHHHYHYGGRYLRYRDGAWLAAASLDGGWLAVSFDEVPSGLRKHHGKSHHRGKHGPPAKHKR